MRTIHDTVHLLPGEVAVGSCSLCGGPVCVPAVYHSVVPPVPTCRGCGAIAAAHGSVIPMQPQRSTYCFVPNRHFEVSS